MRRCAPVRRLPGVVATALAVALLLPTSAGAAVVAEQAGSAVEVTAIVAGADGRLSFVERRASSPRRGFDLARRLRSDKRVVAAAVVQPVRAIATDPLRAQQWGLTRLGAEQVWAAAPASSQLVAVLDTGVDAAHPDLAGVVVDGRDVLAGGTARTDPHGHGTHVAGIVAAVGGNGIGGAGLGRGARVLPVRVLDATGWGNDGDVARGIVWAVDNGATVVNLSLGGTTPSALLSTAIDYALARDVVVVAASGNSGKDGDPTLYPAATPGVIAVGAISQDGTRPDFSSSGPHLALAAPGVSIVSTVPGGGYQPWTGTSMAAPFVAAAAAMLNHAEPALTPAQVRERFMATARDLGAPGRDSSYGAGLVDPAAALAAGRPPVQQQPVATQPVKSAPAPAPAPSAPAATTPAAPTAPAPPATAPRAPAPAAPVLTLRASRGAATVTARRPVSLAVRALADGRPAAGTRVQLEQRVGGGGWKVIRRGTTAGSGLLAVTIRPDRTAEYRFRSGSVTSPALRVAVLSAKLAKGKATPRRR